MERDVRIDTDRDVDFFVVLPCRGFQHLQLVPGFDVEQVDPLADRLINLLLRLSDPGKDDPLRDINAGGRDAMNLSQGDAIEGDMTVARLISP